MKCDKLSSPLFLMGAAEKTGGHSRVFYRGLAFNPLFVTYFTIVRASLIGCLSVSVLRIR